MGTLFVLSTSKVEIKILQAQRMKRQDKKYRWPTCGPAANMIQRPGARDIVVVAMPRGKCDRGGGG